MKTLKVRVEVEVPGEAWGSERAWVASTIVSIMLQPL